MDGRGIQAQKYLVKGKYISAQLFLCIPHNLQEKVSATVTDVNAILATRAQPVSAGCLRRAVVRLTTPCASAEGPASATAVNVRRDTSSHDAKSAPAAQTPARPNCKDSTFTFKLLLKFWFTKVQQKDHPVLIHH